MSADVPSGYGASLWKRRGAPMFVCVCAHAADTEDATLLMRMVDVEREVPHLPPRGGASGTRI